MQNECADRMCTGAERMCRTNVQIECALVQNECADRMCRTETQNECAERRCNGPCAEQMCRAMLQNGSQIADRFLTLIPRHRTARFVACTDTLYLFGLQLASCFAECMCIFPARTTSIYIRAEECM